MHANARRFLVLMLLQAFAVGLSSLFVNLYIWNIDRSLLTQASYSLSSSAAILLSFPLCSLHARRTSPIASSRVGLVMFVLSYAVILWLREDCARHVVLLGAMLGLAVSFFVIGQHMQFLENAQDAQRDRFLYAANIITSFAAIVAPLLAGVVISAPYLNKVLRFRLELALRWRAYRRMKSGSGADTTCASSYVLCSSGQGWRLHQQPYSAPSNVVALVSLGSFSSLAL